MKKHNIYFYSIIFFFAAVISGCKDTISSEELDKVEIPATNVSFQKHIQPVLNQRCALSACHEDGARAGNLSLTSWANATSDYNIVFPGKPENSRLYQVLLPDDIKSMPPRGYSYVTINQVNGIRTWIKEGAKNN